MSQTLVRFAGIGHGEANAIMLPHTLKALERRFPEGFLESLAQALGQQPVFLAERLRDLGGARSLSQAGVNRSDLDRCVEEAGGRPELQMTPPPADATELSDLYAAAY
jgi:alcohol dehydrogenase class IV